jgi:hypothetical protein
MASKIIVDQLQTTSLALNALTLPASNATANQYLQDNGSGVLSWSTVVAGLASVQKPGTGLWTKPAGITKVVVEVQAGGSGGSGANGTTHDGGNGGGGAYAKQFIDVSSIASSTIVVGLGGAGGGNAVAGAVGGTSSWSDGTNVISCTGGGLPEVSVTMPEGGAGGVATGTGAQMLVNGQNGAVNSGYSNQGGDSFLGLGGMNRDEVNTGTPPGPPGAGYGSGGAGGCGRYYQGGGNGGAGVVIVWEYK